MEVCRALLAVTRQASFDAQSLGKGRKSFVVVSGHGNTEKAFARAELEQIVSAVQDEVFGPRKQPGANQIRRAQAKARKEKKKRGAGKKASSKRAKATPTSEAGPSTATAKGRSQIARGVHRAQPLAQSNRGHQLLSQMGWQIGDGLGADRSGITDPIQPSFNAGRRGLG
jgi:hypothetical protein